MKTIKSILDPIVFAIAVIALLFCGCTRTIYTPIETRVETHTNVADSTQTTQISKLIDQLQKSVKTQEKVVIRDSVVYVVNEQGDVKSKEVYRDRDRDYSESETILRVTQIYDSIFQRQAARVDSILSQFKQEPVVIEAESKSHIKGWLIAGAVGVLFIGIFLLYRKLKSKIFH